MYFCEFMCVVQAEIAAAANYPNIRLMTVSLVESPTPLVDFKVTLLFLSLFLHCVVLLLVCRFAVDFCSCAWSCRRFLRSAVCLGESVCFIVVYAATCWFYGKNIFDVSVFAVFCVIVCQLCRTCVFLSASSLHPGKQNDRLLFR